mmetsp:Transcript_15187/g.42525  ORF Transcript_15187/g.42525 Transcript_15187/m.42525 type:complete len:230 (-) Transcript_15187:452-1141(-)
MPSYAPVLRRLSASLMPAHIHAAPKHPMLGEQAEQSSQHSAPWSASGQPSLGVRYDTCSSAFHVWQPRMVTDVFLQAGVLALLHSRVSAGLQRRLISRMSSSMPTWSAAETSNTRHGDVSLRASKLASFGELSSTRSILLATTIDGFSRRMGLYSRSSSISRDSWAAGGRPEVASCSCPTSTTYSRTRVLSTCLRKEWPKPRFAWAPLMSPGMSARVVEEPSANGTLPR